MFSYVSDGLKNDYGIAKAVSVYRDTEENRVVINLSKQEAYMGFSSKVGKSLFGAPEFWKAELVEFKYKAEHTVNDFRYGLEMQVYHKVDQVKSYA